MDDDVRLIRMFDGVVLMIFLGFIERAECDDLSYDGPSENFSLIQLINVGLCNALLVFVSIKDSRAIVRTLVRPLPIQLGRVMGHGKEHLEELTIRDLRWIIGNLDRFGMAALPCADLVIISRSG